MRTTVTAVRRTLGRVAGFLLAALPIAAHTAEPRPENVTPVVMKIAATQPLDLRAPKVTSIFTQEEIDRLLRGLRDPDTIEEVEVARERSKVLPSTTPDIPFGILSPFWALAHPTQAWRIFLPMPPDQARKMGTPADATDSYRPPTLPPQ